MIQQKQNIISPPSPTTTTPTTLLTNHGIERLGHCFHPASQKSDLRSQTKFYHGHYEESITISSSWEGQDDVLEKFPAHKFPVERSGIEVAKNCTKSTAYFSTIIIREPVKNYLAHYITFILDK